MRTFNHKFALGYLYACARALRGLVHKILKHLIMKNFNPTAAERKIPSFATMCLVRTSLQTPECVERAREYDTPQKVAAAIWPPFNELAMLYGGSCDVIRASQLVFAATRRVPSEKALGNFAGLCDA